MIGKAAIASLVFASALLGTAGLRATPSPTLEARALAWADLLPKVDVLDLPKVATRPAMDLQLAQQMFRRKLFEQSPLVRNHQHTPVDGLDQAEKALHDQGRRVVEALEGQLVELSGYAIPLHRTTLDDDFLMVADPGLCSHVKRPPANQVVHVVIRSGMQIETTPATGSLASTLPRVTVTGIITPSYSHQQVYLVDGERDLDSAYFIGATRVVR